MTSFTANSHNIKSMKKKKVLTVKGSIETFSFTSMSQCSGATGIKKELLHLAKGNGCVAFRQHRIYLFPLLRYLFTASPEDLTDWAAHSKKFTALLAESAWRKASGEVISKAVASQVMGEVCALYWGALQRLEFECAAEFEHQDKTFIFAAMQKKMSQLKDEMRAALDRLREGDGDGDGDHPKPEPKPVLAAP